MKLMLITGVPGTGKTTLGCHLAKQHGFRHIDFEREDGLELKRFWRFGERGFRTQVKTLKLKKQDVVVTWGFVPDRQLEKAKAMRSAGFEWIWTDGDRAAARRVFVARGTVEEPLFDAQIKRIETFINPAQLGIRVVNPFDSIGNFRPLEEIADELLAPT
jgi:hypothetical protein